MVLQKVKATEKIIKMIETDNVIVFETDRQVTKTQVAKEVEELFKVKVEKVRTITRKNKKIAFVRLTKEFVASDLASKLGVL